MEDALKTLTWLKPKITKPTTAHAKNKDKELIKIAQIECAYRRRVQTRKFEIADQGAI